MTNPQQPWLPPQPYDPVSPGDSASEFGVDFAHQERLGRKGIPPEDGGPYRAKAPAINPAARRHQTGNPGRQVAP